MGVKSVQTLGSKIRFSNVLDIFSSLPRNNVDISISSTARTTAPTQHLMRDRGIRDLKLDANKLEQILIRESSFNMTRGGMKILKLEA